MKNDEEQVKSKAVTGVVWKLLEKVGMQGMQFVIQIVLARLLLPADYGLVGLLTIFISLSDVFLRQGFTTALIQKKNADELDCSSVFTANLIMSGLIYAALFLLAPGVAVFYHEPRLTEIMRVLSLNVIIGAFSAVHNAIMSKELDFKKSFFRSLSNVLTQGIVGIVLAYMGFGVWALVYSKLAGAAVGSIVLCVTVKWRPRWMFSFARLRRLFSFSSKVLFVNLLNVAYNNIHSIIIGRYFQKAELGFYQRGQQFPQTMMTAVDGSLNEVLYPTLSNLQDDLGKVKGALRRTMKTSVFLVYPLLFGMIAVAEDIIVLLLTEKWLPAVPFMQLSCVVCAFWPFSARTNALNALGMSKLTFRLSLISKSIALIFIYICVPFGIYAILLGSIFTSCITVWINSLVVSRYIHYTVKEFLMDVFPATLIAGIMLIAVMAIGRILPINFYLKIFVEILVGAGVYIGLSKVFNSESFTYVLNMLKGFLRGRAG